MKKQKGFTLIEMLLVMVIISIILFASINYVQQRAEATRIDRATIQMQQILNAGLAYYVANGKWPASLTDLLGGYLPLRAPINPWGGEYYLLPYAMNVTPAAPPMLYVWTAVRGTNPGYASTTATVLLGNLPLGYTSFSQEKDAPPYNKPCDETTTECFVVSMVNIPGQNLNNASAVNFAGLYHHGGCVPVPQCPIAVDGKEMKPEVLVLPVSVSGVNDPNPNQTRIYPISSFTAYATAPKDLPDQPDACTNGTVVNCQPDFPGPKSYWRVCLQVVTEKGDVALTRKDDNTTIWGSQVTLAAFTRCEINQEPAGSPFTVFSK